MEARAIRERRMIKADVWGTEKDFLMDSQTGVWVKMVVIFLEKWLNANGIRAMVLMYIKIDIKICVSL
jgi:hypothetical protein